MCLLELIERYASARVDAAIARAEGRNSRARSCREVVRNTMAQIEKQVRDMEEKLGIGDTGE